MESIKKIAWIKIGISLITLVAGVLTCVFAIMKMANITTCDPTTSLRILIGVILILCGAILLIVGFIQDKEKIDVKDAVVGGAAVGLGVFWLLSKSATVLEAVVGVCFPIVIACAALALSIKYIIAGIRKSPKREWIAQLVVSLVWVGLGIAFACIPETINFTWLIVGICVVVSSIYAMIPCFKVINKERKAKKEAKKAAKEAKKAEKKAAKEAPKAEEKTEVEVEKPAEDNTENK